MQRLNSVNPQFAQGRTKELLETVQQAFGVEQLRIEPSGTVICRWRAAREELVELHRRLVNEGVAVVSFAARRSNLEDIYMQISRHRTS